MAAKRKTRCPVTGKLTLGCTSDHKNEETHAPGTCSPLCEACAAKLPAPKHSFTPDELKVLHGAAVRVWEYIGYDIATALAEEGRNSISRAEILELVIDADRLADELRKPQGLRGPGHAGIADKLRALLDSKGGYDAVETLLKPAFPYSRCAL